MRLSGAVIVGYRSIDYLEFEAGPFTVLFGKNNTGKTNVLEALYEILGPGATSAADGQTERVRGLRGSDAETGIPRGAVFAQLEPGKTFDEDVLSLGSAEVGTLLGDFDGVEVPRLPPRQVAFVGDYDESLLIFGDPRRYFLRDHDVMRGQAEYLGPDHDDQFRSFCVEGPRPERLFLDWEFEDIDRRVGAAILKPLISPVMKQGGRPPKRGWLERVDVVGSGETWRVRPEIYERIENFASLAMEFMPDFIDGAIRARFNVPSGWGEAPSLSVEFEDFATGVRVDSVADIGRGAARWIAVATQIAQHLIVHGGFDAAHAFFVDEPEAHLHPSAVASIVRWCQRLVSLGLNVVVASHHEEFLRAARDEYDAPTLVHIRRDTVSGSTTAHSLPTASATRLLDLAEDIGMTAASALSIHRAFLYVEGPLDEAVLEEYGGLELDAAGVKVIPIHGTKNLEGLVAAEVVTNLGIKTGVLTDATDPKTMVERAGRKRSSEERKVLRVIQMAEEKGLPAPTSFGVPEADLLFALPPDAIREYLAGPFPEWNELVAECREAFGKGPSDSVNWKAYAEDHYGLKITTPSGVRALVRELDLKSVPLPSIRAVIDDIVAWAGTSE